jgi:hypothetical protein
MKTLNKRKSWSNSIYRNGLSFNQQQAFDLIHEWYDTKPESPFVLRGFAGTGKSYCIQRVIQSLQECFYRDHKGKISPINIALCAPTHKSRHVLEAMANTAGLRIHIATLHSLLHLIPGEYDENGKQQLKKNTFTREPHYSEFDLVVVDESSMLGQELLNSIPSNIPTIFMGDPAQLPPVEDQVTESPVFSLPIGLELTEVMRYQGVIAEYVTALRQDLSVQFPPRLHTRGNITKLSYVDWIQAAINLYQQDRSSVKVLAWTNNRVNVLNQEIRSALYPDAEQIEEGEILFAKEPIFIRADAGERKEIFMNSCAECQVIGFKEYSGTRHYLIPTPFQIYKIDVINDMAKKACLAMIHPNSWELIKTAVSAEKKRILALKAMEKKTAWREYYEFLETYNLVVKGGLMHRLQYGYAITVHQSQGGTFANCFVDTSNIFGCQDKVMRNKLLYVAYTRAANNLFCYSKW